MSRKPAVLSFLLILLGCAASANTLSGTAVFPKGLTSVDAVFDASISFLKVWGFPVAGADRKNGTIESSITRYHSKNAGSSETLEDVSYWNLTFATNREGGIEIHFERGSALEVTQQEIVDLFANFAFERKLDPSRIALTIDGEMHDLAQWRGED